MNRNAVSVNMGEIGEIFMTGHIFNPLRRVGCGTVEHDYSGIFRSRRKIPL